jgi:integrase
MDLNKADRTLRNLKPKDRSYAVALGDGISCRVAPNGTKTLELRARLHDKTQRLVLGHYPATTISDAVAKAADYRSMLKQGLHPKVELQRAAQGDIPRNVTEAAARFISEHLDVKTRDKWRVEATRIIEIEILPELGHYPLVQLRRTDLTAVVDKKAAALRKAGKRGVMANRIAAVMGKLFTWCADRGWISSDLGRRLPKPAKEEARERALTPEEAGAVWNLLSECATATGPIPTAHARVLQLLALTGARCSEITGLAAGSVDLTAATFTIANAKNASSNRTLPLTPAARAVIEAALVGQGGDGLGLLFPSPRAGTQIPSNEISRSARDLVQL